jgi:hypothetical protein
MSYMPKRQLQPFRDVILKLDKPLAETIKKGKLELYLDPTWNPEQHVTVTGIVYALPPNHPYGDSLKVGDTVCFSYQVVADREFDETPDHYHTYVDEENLQIFYNGHMEKIQVRAVQGIITKKFICAYFDKHGEFQEGYEGTFHEKDRWLSQFKFGNTERYRFKNCIDWDGELLWKCKFEEIFAKKVGKKLIALGDRLILNPVKMEIPEAVFTDAGLEIPKSTMYGTLQNEAKIESVPRETKLKKGQRIEFNGMFKEKYEFFGKQYFLVNKNLVEGVWLN